MLDLDGLKIVNDIQGHTAGDCLIIETAKLIQSSCRELDVCARCGGDEFMVLLPETCLDEGKIVLQKIRCNLEKAGISASMEVSACHPVKGLERAVDATDLVMYRQKSKNKHDSNQLAKSGFVKSQ